MAETVLAVTKPFQIGNPDSLVVIIPKEVRKRLKIEKGQLLHVKIDGKGRLIYEPFRVET